MKEAKVRAIFELADIEVLGLYELANQYLPRCPEYQDLINATPWWLVKTKYGLIEIGWRKRVISINWEDTKLDFLVSEDDVTKSGSGIHAWSYIKAVEYLSSLRRLAEKDAHKSSE